MTRDSRRGFTLIEVIIALTSATLLVVMFAGLRVGLAAWQRGDERAEALQRERSITEILTSALAATHPYQVAAKGREPAHLLFEGEPARVAFVTAAAPFPAAQPIAYTAVTLSQDADRGWPSARRCPMTSPSILSLPSWFPPRLSRSLPQNPIGTRTISWTWPRKRPVAIE
jgi:type II secretory pathway pseudopilin PulG